MSVSDIDAAQKRAPKPATLTDHALRLAGFGLRVFPLIPGGKTPALEADWQRIATAEPDKVRRLWMCPITQWEQPYNIGVALDADTLVVDVDVRDGRKGRESLKLLETIYDPLPGSYRVRTASKGDHHYYRIDGRTGPFAKALGENVDLKTIGGYVVGEGSIIDGKRYVAAAGDPSDLETFPSEWLTLAQRGGREHVEGDATPLVEPDDPAAIERAKAWLESAEPAVEGDGGDATTYRTAAKVIDFGVSPEMALDLMLDHWNDRCAPPWDPVELKVKVDNAARYRQAPAGVASPEAEFEAVEVAERAQATLPLVVENIGGFHWSIDQTPHLVRDLLLPRMIGFLTGRPNMGKSPLALDLAAHIAKGEPWQGGRSTLTL